MLYFNYLFYFFRSFILLSVLSFYFLKKKIKRMPLPSGLKIKRAKVILFLKLQSMVPKVFLSTVPFATIFQLVIPLFWRGARRAGWFFSPTFSTFISLITKLYNNILLELLHHIIQIMFYP